MPEIGFVCAFVAEELSVLILLCCSNSFWLKYSFARDSFICFNVSGVLWFDSSSFLRARLFASASTTRAGARGWSWCLSPTSHDCSCCRLYPFLLPHRWRLCWFLCMLWSLSVTSLKDFSFLQLVCSSIKSSNLLFLQWGLLALLINYFFEDWPLLIRLL